MESIKLFKNNIFDRFKRRNKGEIKAFFSQFSRGLMLPISILPIAGLLLGIGGAIGANVHSSNGLIIANIFKGMSEVVFATMPILFSVAITITFSKDRGTAAFSSLLAYLVFCSSQMPFFQKEGNNIVSIMWFHNDVNINNIITSTLGFTTLNTSIFGGIIIGLLTSFIYNKVSKIKLPSALDFFSGNRLVPIVLIPTVFLVALLFLIFWPWIGLAITYLGQNIQKAPYGTGGLLYGILGRSLMPFGLHHIPIILAFQTDFGGVINLSDLQNALINNGINENVCNTIVDSFKSINSSSISGDQNIWNFINGLPYNELWDSSLNRNIPIFEWFTKNLDVYPGRYTQDYPTYLGVNLAIGAAIIISSKKDNRKQVATVVGSSMVVAFLTGITEPLEYTFLFCAPLLYYLIYVPISGFSYMFMELAGAHIGTGFARGFIDLVIYGAIPYLKGTQFYWAFVFAAIEGGLVFLLFWYLIKRFNLQTPGRGENIYNLIDKKQYKELKKNKNNESKSEKIIEYLGGKENIVSVSACATRLRVTLKDISTLNKENFKNIGSKGEVFQNKNVQIIFGGESSILADEINDILDDNSIIDNSDLSTIVVEENYHEFDNNNFSSEPFDVFAPCDGIIFSLENVNDEAFKTKSIGLGLAIKPMNSKFFSPLKEGKISNIFDTKHCYIFQTPNNQNVMVHIGIDSVLLDQSPFNLKMNENDDVSLDSNVLDIDLIKLSKAKSSITPIVIPDFYDESRIRIHVKNNQIVKRGDLIFSIL